jgi:hypothetical protein
MKKFLIILQAVSKAKAHSALIIIMFMAFSPLHSGSDSTFRQHMGRRRRRRREKGPEMGARGKPHACDDAKLRLPRFFRQAKNYFLLIKFLFVVFAFPCHAMAKALRLVCASSLTPPSPPKNIKQQERSGESLRATVGCVGF